VLKGPSGADDVTWTTTNVPITENVTLSLTLRKRATSVNLDLQEMISESVEGDIIPHYFSVTLVADNAMTLTYENCDGEGDNFRYNQSSAAGAFMHEDTHHTDCAKFLALAKRLEAAEGDEELDENELNPLQTIVCLRLEPWMGALHNDGVSISYKSYESEDEDINR
jgi:hypothetical protein